MTSLTLSHASSRRGIASPDRPHTDLMRLALLLMLFLNVALATMVLAPDSDPRPVSQSAWHGNATGVPME